jgi:hypothetical protein
VILELPCFLQAHSAQTCFSPACLRHFCCFFASWPIGRRDSGYVRGGACVESERGVCRGVGQAMLRLSVVRVFEGPLKWHTSSDTLYRAPHSFCTTNKRMRVCSTRLRVM